MKTKYILLFPLLSVLFPVAASAQGTVGDLESSFGARFSVEADKKLAKGVHAIVSGEARMTDGIGSPDRYQAGLELTYKLNDTFKFGVGYLLIEKMNSSGEWNPRHRFYADGKVSFRSGDWLFSVKERLQLTHREVGNVFQNTTNSLSLKSRFKVSYKGFGSVTPYGYIECAMYSTIRPVQRLGAQPRSRTRTTFSTDTRTPISTGYGAPWVRNGRCPRAIRWISSC